MGNICECSFLSGENSLSGRDSIIGSDYDEVLASIHNQNKKQVHPKVNIAKGLNDKVQENSFEVLTKIG